MALLDSEIQRIKYELGYNVLSVGAEPYIGIAAIFDQVIKPYTLSGAITSSSTTVTASDTPTPVTITLASGTGFSTLCRVVIDVDDREEIVTAQNVSGNSLTVLLQKAHSGTYPVTVEGGESIIREILRHLRKIAATDGGLDSAVDAAGIKELVGDVVFFGANGEQSRFRTLRQAREYWRGELARALGLEYVSGADAGVEIGLA